ncbi:MAG: hypothetical protein HN564_06145 [Flavobacteriales bacterium]|jgi:hypothetical protein|nr:hypothetical protein [Flavobacteriales bacterium]
MPKKINVTNIKVKKTSLDLDTDIINNRKEALDLIGKLTEIVLAQGKVIDKIKGRMGI